MRFTHVYTHCIQICADCRDLSKTKLFTLIHCSNILKNEPKWHVKQRELAGLKQATNKKQMVNSYSTQENSDKDKKLFTKNILRKIQIQMFLISRKN